MGAITSAAGDAFITFLWVIFSSTLDAGTSIVATALNATGVPGTLLITVALIALLLFPFNLLADTLGGASFNPTATAAFYAAGLGSDSLFSMALRFPAQAVGALGGALTILELMPPEYRRTLGGPALKVDQHTGAAAEAVLTFVITLAVLLIVVRGPKNRIAQAWMLAVSTVALVIAGVGYTGPSMNPANAFGWAYVSNRHNTWEQLYVYWICPFIGAILAAWIFRIFFAPPAPKVKKA